MTRMHEQFLSCDPSKGHRAAPTAAAILAAASALSSGGRTKEGASWVGYQKAAARGP